MGTLWRLKACSGSISEGCGSWCTHKTSKGYWWNTAFTDIKSKIVNDIHRAMTSISGCCIHLDMFPSVFHVWRSHVSFVRNEPRDIIISSLNLQLLCVLFTAFNAHIPAQSSVSRIKTYSPELCLDRDWNRFSAVGGSLLIIQEEEDCKWLFLRQARVRKESCLPLSWSVHGEVPLDVTGLPWR